jgi:hypothetical protein
MGYSSILPHSSRSWRLRGESSSRIRTGCCAAVDPARCPSAESGRTLLRECLTFHLSNIGLPQSGRAARQVEGHSRSRIDSSGPAMLCNHHVRALTGEGQNPMTDGPESFEACGWAFETEEGRLEGHPMLPSRLSRVVILSLLATCLTSCLLILMDRAPRARIPERSLIEVLRGWPTALLVAPLAWWLSRGRIEIDTAVDAYRFGSRSGRAREIRVIWLDRRLGLSLRLRLNIGKYGNSENLSAGLADGSEVWIVGDGESRSLATPSGDLEGLGQRIARLLKVPLQRRMSEP